MTKTASPTLAAVRALKEIREIADEMYSQYLDGEIEGETMLSLHSAIDAAYLSIFTAEDEEEPK